MGVLCSTPVYLICLILVSVLCVCVSVCLSLFPPLCWFSSPSPWFGPGLSCPVLSSPPGSPLPSRRLVSFGLVFFPLQTTSPPLPHLLSLSPQNKASRACAAQRKHRTQSILQARHLLTEFSHCAHLPSPHQSGGQPLSPSPYWSLRQAFGGSSGTCPFEQVSSGRVSSPFKLYIESCLASPRHRVPQKPSEPYSQLSWLPLHLRQALIEPPSSWTGFLALQTDLLQLAQLSRALPLPPSTSYPFRALHRQQSRPWLRSLQLH